MTVPEDDLDRVRSDYTDSDGNLTLDDVRDDLKDADFEGDSLDAFTDAIAGDSDLAVSESALQEAQSQAIESLSSGGAVGGEIVRAEDGFTAIGKPENVEQRIERTGRTSGDVIARNKNTGTEGRIGSVELAPPPEVE
jgi:hypothetical protein